MLNKLIWCLKQLLPLGYHAVYKDNEGGVHYVTWFMWLGRCFNVDDEVVYREET